MDSVEVIKKAIELRKPVEFYYNKEGKISGKRIGNPHAIYRDPKTDNINVDIYQTDGVSDQPEKIPDWRVFTVKFINNAEILKGSREFDIADGYDPDSLRYVDVIAKL